MALRNRATLYRQLLDSWTRLAPSSNSCDPSTGAFTGATLNSPQRSNPALLQQLFSSPRAQFLLFRGSNTVSAAESGHTLGYFGASDILTWFANPFDGPGSHEPKVVLKDWVLLGIDDAEHPTGDSYLAVDLPAYYANQPVYWAIDVNPVYQAQEEGPLKNTAQLLDTAMQQGNYRFSEARSVAFHFNAMDSTLFAQASAMEAGYKRICPPDEVSGEITGQDAKPPCVNRRGIHNSAYPRTDPVVIVCVLSPDRSRILLGRKVSFPTRWYTCVAGFVEPGETLEAAVRREVLEETGVAVGPVLYFGNQPWVQ
ncbi:NADH pyrophosphatase [Dimargaris cristalligena]|nr:NADH pyrophosphatase [Dimargaris cristalligena]